MKILGFECLECFYPLLDSTTVEMIVLLSLAKHYQAKHYQTVSLN